MPPHRPKPTLGPSHLSDLLSSHPELAEELQARESSALKDPEMPSIELTPELSAKLRRVEELERAEHALRTKEAELKKLESQTKLRTVFRRLMAACVPTRIGGRDGIHPSSLDIRIEEVRSPSSSSSSYIAWIPVPLWPVAKPGKPFLNRYTGQSQMTADLGETSVTESLSTALVYVPELDAAGNLKRRPVSLKGFARISVSSQTPAEIERRADRRELKSLFEDVSPASDHDDEVDTAAHGGASMDEAPFIPSEVRPVSFQSRPVSPSSPFSLEGDTQ